MLVYLPSTGELTELKDSDIISFREEENAFIPIARVYRGITWLLIGVGAERRYDYSVFLRGNGQEKWEPKNVSKALKIIDGILEPLPSSDETTHNYVFKKIGG